MDSHQDLCFVIEQCCLSTSLLGCRWYVYVIRCSTPVSACSSFASSLRIDCLFILISKHPQQQIIFYKDCAVARASLSLTELVCTRLENWSMQTLKWYRSSSSAKGERQQLFISLHLEKLESWEVHFTLKLVSFFVFKYAATLLRILYEKNVF